MAVTADITDRTQAPTAVEQTVDRFGRLDLLINAGRVADIGNISSIANLTAMYFDQHWASCSASSRLMRR